MLEKLEFMIALAREKHFGRAAQSCGVAQPTLSVGIQSLEEMLNVTLVKRSSRFQGFTREGERVLVWAHRIVGDAHAMRQEVFGLQNGDGLQIRLAVIPSAMAMISMLTIPFQERHPAASLTVTTRSSDALLSLLHNRDIDAGITYVDNEPIEDAIQIPLFREEYFLLTAAQGPLGQRERVGWTEIGSLPLCLLTRDFQQRRIVDEALSSVSVKSKPKIEMDSSVALASHVATGRWVSIVSRSMIQSIELGASLRAIPIEEPQVTRTIGLVVSQRYAMQPAVEALIEQARLLCPPAGPLPAARSDQPVDQPLRNVEPLRSRR